MPERASPIPTQPLPSCNAHGFPAPMGDGVMDASGLINYGQILGENFRHSATDVDRILKGSKLGDLPVEQLPRFYLTINMKTARALGLTVPRSLLLRGDEVIQ